jgi:phage tail sheath gpL-like
MSISFNHFPANWKLPLVWIEVDASQAGTVTLNQPAIVIGQKFASGTAPSNIPIAVASLADAKTFFGEGSMLERMASAFLANNAAARLFFMPLDELGSGVAATGSIAVSSAPTQAGILSLYIAGQRVQVGVIGTESASVMATNIAAAINAMNTLPVSAVAASASVNLTCRWKGLTGNDINLQANYLGSIGGESMPVGMALTFTPMASGAGAPDLTAAIAGLGDDIYDYCACPFTDSVSLGALETEYGFGDTGRWGWMRQIYGTIFAARRDTYAGMMTWGATGNSPVSSVMTVEVPSPTPVWEWAAAYTAQAALALLNDPARPLQTLELNGVLPAPKGLRLIKTQLNNLASTGLAVAEVSPNGLPMIMVEASRYQKNIYGQGDTAYFVITTLHTLAAIFRRLNQAISSKYPRHKLANDGTRFGPGQAIITPNVARAELVAEYRAMEYDGLVENVEKFKSTMIVERDDNNPNRLNVLYPPDVINQLRTFAVLAQFRLQFSTIAP